MQLCIALSSTFIIFCSRYLFVNFRPWAKNAFIPDPYNPPPVALSVERVVIDLTKMEVCSQNDDFYKVQTKIIKLLDYRKITP